MPVAARWNCQAQQTQNLPGMMEVAAGLGPAKVGFADRHLDRFGIKA